MIMHLVVDVAYWAFNDIFLKKRCQKRRGRISCGGGEIRREAHRQGKLGRNKNHPGVGEVALEIWPAFNGQRECAPEVNKALQNDE